MKTATSIAALAIVTAFGAFGTQAIVRAQDPSLRWVKAAPFPEPEEELYGVSVNGKMYVIGGAVVRPGERIRFTIGHSTDLTQLAGKRGRARRSARQHFRAASSSSHADLSRNAVALAPSST